MAARFHIWKTYLIACKHHHHIEIQLSDSADLIEWEVSELRLGFCSGASDSLLKVV